MSFRKNIVEWIKDKFTIRLTVLLLETLLPVLIGFLTFFISEEGIKIYKKFFSQISGESQAAPLTSFEWVIVVVIPLSTIGWVVTIIYRYKEQGKVLRLEESEKNLADANQKIQLYELNVKSLVNGFI